MKHNKKPHLHFYYTLHSQFFKAIPPQNPLVHWKKQTSYSHNS